MRLTERVLRLDSTKGAYCYLLMDQEIALVDTGFGFQGGKIRVELKKLGIALTDIKHILLTHHDVDHVGNVKLLQALSGATVWAHEKDIPFITGAKERYGFKKYLGRLTAHNRVKDICAYPSGGAVGNIRILEAPGHTPGHTCLLFDGVLFVGDLVKNKGGVLHPYPAFWNWDNQMHLASIKALRGEAFE